MNITTIGLDTQRCVSGARCGWARQGRGTQEAIAQQGLGVLCRSVAVPHRDRGLSWSTSLGAGIDGRSGHSVKLMPAQYVKAYLKGQKTDGNDAEAIREAVSRPGMRSAAINTEAQQDLQMLHRIRHRFVGVQALINQIRGC